MDHTRLMDAIFQQSSIRVALLGRNLADLLPLLEQFPVQLVEDSPELVISHGGDGALLGAERSYPGVPKFPIRDRRQNPKCPQHDEKTVLSKLFAGELQRSELCKLVARTESGAELCGINDVVLSRELATSAIRYRLWLDGQLYRGQIVADSLVVATPFGSTGYFQSITHGNIRTGIGLAFNNSLDLLGHTVVPEHTALTVQLLRGPAVLVADNDRQQIPIQADDRLHIHVLAQKTPVYGIEVFRCYDCYHLRRDGVK
jgi:NAD kinase